MQARVLITAAALCAGLMPSTLARSTVTPNMVASEFWKLRNCVLKGSQIESCRLGDAYNLVSRKVTATKAKLEYTGWSGAVIIEIDQTTIPDVAKSTFITVSTKGAEKDFSDELQKLIGKMLGQTKTKSLSLKSGWQSYGWVFEDGDPTVVMAVSFNPRSSVAEIWSHQLQVGDE